MSSQTLLLLSLLLISLAATSAWGEEPGAAEATSHDSVQKTSNIEGWDEDEDKANDPDWTFFGMGYENRTSAAPGSAAATAASVGGGKGKGGGKK